MKNLILSLFLLTTFACDAQQYANQFKNTIPATNAWVIYNLPKGKLYDFEAYNVSASTVYVLIYDTNAIPSDGAFPTFAPLALPANSTASFTFPGGCGFTNGITVVASTTPITKTNAGAVLKMRASYGGSQ
jgi:hypothetical protein